MKSARGTGFAGIEMMLGRSWPDPPDVFTTCGGASPNGIETGYRPARGSFNEAKGDGAAAVDPDGEL